MIHRRKKWIEVIAVLRWMTLRLFRTQSSVVGIIGKVGLGRRVGIAQAWAPWSGNASAQNDAVMCHCARGYGVPEMITQETENDNSLYSKFRRDIWLDILHRSHTVGDTKPNTTISIFRIALII